MLPRNFTAEQAAELERRTITHARTSLVAYLTPDSPGATDVLAPAVFRDARQRTRNTAAETKITIEDAFCEAWEPTSPTNAVIVRVRAGDQTGPETERIYTVTVWASNNRDRFVTTGVHLDNVVYS